MPNPFFCYKRVNTIKRWFISLNSIEFFQRISHFHFKQENLFFIHVVWFADISKKIIILGHVRYTYFFLNSIYQIFVSTFFRISWPFFCKKKNQPNKQKPAKLIIFFISPTISPGASSLMNWRTQLGYPSVMKIFWVISFLINSLANKQ